MSTTLSQEIDQLISGNTIYNQNRDQWQFLLESYVGGRVYQEARHLTRYVNETDGEYNARLKTTPLHNHSKSIISVYISFLFRKECVRELGALETAPGIEEFLEDADFDGRSLTAFMKEVAVQSSVFGHTWILVTKPNINAVTRAEELAAGIRPYLNQISPLAMLDWSWTRMPNGRYVLSYIKYQEDVNGNVQTIKEWTQDSITTTVVDTENEVIEQILVEPNQLGKIPAVIAYNSQSGVRGIGTSDIADIAALQKFIYNAVSEIEQSIRLNTHPSLVKTADTNAGIGSGSVIEMPENLDPGLKPYFLEYTGASVNSILQTIAQTEDTIDKIANTGGVRATESRTISGVALETEFQLLNARLSEKADNLELAEEQIWKLVCDYVGTTWTGTITYPGSFNIRDTNSEIAQLKTARDTATSDELLARIDQRLGEWLDDEEY